MVRKEQRVHLGPEHGQMSKPTAAPSPTDHNGRQAIHAVSKQYGEPARTVRDALFSSLVRRF